MRVLIGKLKEVTVFAPATIGNVGCGFDIFGLALEYPGDKVVVKRREKPGVEITAITGDNGQLPRAAEKNTAGISVIRFLEHINISHGIEIELHKMMPIGSGLGSSSASTVASVCAANVLVGKPLATRELLPFALEGERVACGSAHADNVASCLLGGFVLVRSYHPLDVVSIPIPHNLYCALIYPKLEILTRDARKLLPKKISLNEGVIQWANTAGLIAGLMKPDYELIRRSLQDVVAEPARSNLIPGFHEIKQAALDTGALGSSFSGSGPSIFALCKNKSDAYQSAMAMQSALAPYQIGCDLFITRINRKGPRVLKTR
jgi:homoserine kinase